MQSPEKYLQDAVDSFYSILPRPRPELSALWNCKIVSHRGEHNNIDIMENTLDAFEPVYRDGVWGIELDIRWSKDLQPVVIHDADCARVFHSPLAIREHSLAEIQARIPQISGLQQVIEKYGKKLHLMIEIKQEDFPDIELQRSRLGELLSGLTPSEDYHLLALNTGLFDLFDIAPNSAMLPVAEFNLARLSKRAINNRYAGISGQYLLLTNRQIKKHHQKTQKIGVGFVRSRFSFYRELNRDIDWIFTNHAIKLNHIRKKLIEKQELRHL
jgi:glycerophosphoryl diester phosphodiesterase